MPPFRTNYLSNPHWDTPQKVASRADTILAPYRAWFRRRRIPSGTQYWTVCGAHYTGVEGCEVAARGEYCQHLAAKLYDASQFHGVDKSPRTIALNQRFHPSTHWHCGDFLEVLRSAAVQGTLNPAILNYDSVHEPRRAAAYLRRLMRFIDGYVPGELMLVVNVVLGNPRAGASHQFGVTDLIELLESGTSNGYLLPDHWTLAPRCYVYGGGASENSRSKMGTFIFLKARHSKVVVTPGRPLTARAAGTAKK